MKDELSFLRYTFEEEYINNPEYSFQKFWKDHHKTLPILAKRCVSVSIAPLSSVPSESFFSIAGQVHRKERSRLDPETLTLIMLLKGSKIVSGLINKFDL